MQQQRTYRDTLANLSQVRLVADFESDQALHGDLVALPRALTTIRTLAERDALFKRPKDRPHELAQKRENQTTVVRLFETLTKLCVVRRSCVWV